MSRKLRRLGSARFVTLSSMTRISEEVSLIPSRIHAGPKAICCVNVAYGTFRFEQVDKIFILTIICRNP